MKTLTILFFLLLCLEGCSSPTASTDNQTCDGWIPGNTSYTQEATVDEAWSFIQQHVLTRTYSPYLASSPHFCEAQQLEEINCAAQATLMAGYLKHIISSRHITIVKWGSPSVDYTHVNVQVDIDDELWIFDRNYSDSYPHMPILKKDWLMIYGDNIYQVSSSDI